MKVSVVIPVYNVEKYLDKCLESVVKQSYQDLEILLVDDGATDTSGYICDQWALKDKRIQVIHKENGGLSDARNVGIQHASGTYIIFVDSDDYIDRCLIQHLIYLISDSDSEIAICKFQYVYDDNFVDKNKICMDYECFTGRDAVLKRYKEQEVQFVTAWAKLYHRKFFVSYRYPYKKYHEDEFLTYKLLYEAKKIARSNERLYYYRQRSDSIMGEMKLIHPDLIEAQKCAVFYFETNKDMELAGLAYDWMLTLEIERYYQLNDVHEKREFYKNIKTDFEEGLSKGLLSSERKIKKLFLINPILYKTIIPYLRKIKYILRRKIR